MESEKAFFPRLQQRQYNNSWGNMWYPKQFYNYVDGFNRRFLIMDLTEYWFKQSIDPYYVFDPCYLTTMFVPL